MDADIQKLNDLVVLLSAPTDEIDFHKAIVLGMDALHLVRHNVSDMFSTSGTIVDRWRTGKSAPHSIVRTIVYREFLSRALEQLKEAQ